MKIVKATVEHAQAIKLRAADLQEVAAWLPGIDPIVALRFSIAASTETFAGVCGGSVVFVGGYSVGTHEVTPWLMFSDQIGEHRFAIMRAAQGITSLLLSKYPDKLICNHSHRDNKQARRMLERLGFRFRNAPGEGPFDFFYHPKSCA